MPGFLRKTPHGTVFNSLPYFGPNAGLLVSDGAPKDELYAFFFNELDAFLNKAGIIAATIYEPVLSSDKDLYLRHFRPETVLERTTQMTPIEKSGAWSKDVAWDVKKAQKNGVSIKAVSDQASLDAFYEIYEENCRALGIPLKAKVFFQAALKDGLLGKQARLTVATKDGAVIAGLWAFFGAKTLSYYSPASRQEHRGLQPLSLLIDEMFAEARRRGLQYWNWESSPSPESGVFKFKAKWNAEVFPYRVFTKLYREKSFIAKIAKDPAFAHYFLFPFSLL